jgi:hypothetical protein
MQTARGTEIGSLTSNKAPSIICWALLVLLPCAVPAQPMMPDEATLLQQLDSEQPSKVNEAARKLGDIGSEAALQHIIARHDAHALAAYGRVFCAPITRRVIERLAIEHFDDPTLHRELLRLVFGCGGIRTMEYFHLLVAEIQRQGGSDFEREERALLLVHTDLPVEAEVLKLLTAFPVPPAGAARPCVQESSPRRPLIRFLGERKYAPAAAEIERLLTPAPLDEIDLCEALARIPTALSVRAAVRCVQRYAARPADAQARRCTIERVLRALATAPREVPLPFDDLKAALPQPLEAELARPYIMLIGHRHETAGAPELINYLHVDPGAPGGLGRAALSALLEFESAEVWRAALTEMERLHSAGTINDRQLQFVKSEVQRRLQDPQKFVQQKHEAAQAQREDQQLQMQRRKQFEAFQMIEALRKTEAERYAREYAAYIDQLEQAATNPKLDRHHTLDQDLARHCGRLGTFLRFTLKRPAQAVRFYQRAAAAISRSDGSEWVLQIAVADTYRFDLHDDARAIASYQDAASVLTRMPQQGHGDAPELRLALSKWLEHEIAFLKTKAPFAGTVTRTDRMAAGVLVFALAADALGWDAVSQDASVRSDRQQVAQEVLSLPPSQLNLARAFPLWSLLSASEIVTFLGKHDPGRFLSASVLAAGVADARRAQKRSDADSSSIVLGATGADEHQRSELPQAVKIFAQQTGVRFDLEASPQFATPEQTWKYLLDSLNAGNGRAALTCFTSDFARQVEPLFTGMNTQQMQAMAGSFGRLVSTSDMGNRKEYGVTRLADGEKRAAMVYFIDEDGEWKISSM